MMHHRYHRLPFIQSADFHFPGIHHAFFTRQGGVSKGMYSSLNCAFKSNDHPESITQNQQLAMEFLGRSPRSLLTVRNVHGNVTLPVSVSSLKDKHFHQSPADAMVTKDRGITLGSYSADCPIILFADPVHRVIGIAHAGWRGAKCGVAESTVTEMLRLGAKISNIFALIGPCIQQRSYEVDKDFYLHLLEDHQFPHVEQSFSPTALPSYFLFDLPYYITQRLHHMGIINVGSIGIDTYKNEDDFFSRRRSFHRQESDFGCHLSVIYLE